jgi:hypothetical protein
MSYNRLIKIARYLGRNGFYEEAYKLSKMASSFRGGKFKYTIEDYEREEAPLTDRDLGIDGGVPDDPRLDEKREAFREIISRLKFKDADEVDAITDILREENSKAEPNRLGWMVPPNLRNEDLEVVYGPYGREINIYNQRGMIKFEKAWEDWLDSQRVKRLSESGDPCYETFKELYKATNDGKEPESTTAKIDLRKTKLFPKDLGSLLQAYVRFDDVERQIILEGVENIEYDDYNFEEIICKSPNGMELEKIQKAIVEKLGEKNQTQD